MPPQHLGVYARLHHEGKILLVKKTRGPYTGLWDLPGGKIESGESPEEALQREIMEETGLEAHDFKLITVLHYHHPAMHHLGIIYHAQVDPSLPTKESPDGEDAGGAFWIPCTNLHAGNSSPFVLELLTLLP